MFRKSTVLLINLSFLFGAVFVSAHTGGTSLEKVVGDSFIDIGYDPPGLSTGSYTTFDLTLSRISDGTPQIYEHVWVRILKDGALKFATGIHAQERGATTIIYTFDEPGEYTFEASFRNTDGTIAEASFPLNVTRSEGSPTFSPFLWGAMVAVLALLSIGWRKLAVHR